MFVPWFSWLIILKEPPIILTRSSITISPNALVIRTVQNIGVIKALAIVLYLK